MIDFAAEWCDHLGCERRAAGSWDGGLTVHCDAHLPLYRPSGDPVTPEYALLHETVMPAMAEWAARQKREAVADD
jgi:Rieske Fe-S protein